MIKDEHSGTLWNPIIWPYKFVVPAGCAPWFLLQGTHAVHP